MLYTDPHLTTIAMSILAVFAMGIASYLDWNSTSEAIKRGTGHEGNPPIAWLMAKLGRAFPTVFIGLKTLAVFAMVRLALRMPSPNFWIAGILALTGAYLVFVVARNYDISK